MWCHPRKKPYLYLELKIGDERENFIKKFDEADIEIKEHRISEILNISLTDKDFNAHKDLIADAIRVGEQYSRQ